MINLLSILHLFSCSLLRRFGPSARRSDECVTAESDSQHNMQDGQTDRSDGCESGGTTSGQTIRRMSHGREGQGRRDELRNQQMSITLILSGRQKERLDFCRLVKAKGSRVERVIVKPRGHPDTHVKELLACLLIFSSGSRE